LPPLTMVPQPTALMRHYPFTGLARKTFEPTSHGQAWSCLADRP
jgi:hypothetical protein